MNNANKDNFGNAALIVALFVSIAASVFSNDASAKAPTKPSVKPAQLETIVVTAKRLK